MLTQNVRWCRNILHQIDNVHNYFVHKKNIELTGMHAILT